MKYSDIYTERKNIRLHFDPTTTIIIFFHNKHYQFALYGINLCTSFENFIDNQKF